MASYLFKLPLSRRRDLLENLLAAYKDPMRLSPLLQEQLSRFLRRCAGSVFEGVVAKTERLHIRTRRAIGCLDQAPH